MPDKMYTLLWYQSCNATNLLHEASMNFTFSDIMEDKKYKKISKLLEMKGIIDANQIKAVNIILSNRITRLYSEYNTEWYLEENVQCEAHPVLVAPRKVKPKLWLFRLHFNMINQEYGQIGQVRNFSKFYCCEQNFKY